MSIGTRLNKLEQYLKPNGKETDLSHLTIKELDFLIDSFENDNLNNSEVKRLLSTIDFKEDFSNLTDEELEEELNKLHS